MRFDIRLTAIAAKASARHSVPENRRAIVAEPVCLVLDVIAGSAYVCHHRVSPLRIVLLRHQLRHSIPSNSSADSANAQNNHSPRSRNVALLIMHTLNELPDPAPQTTHPRVHVVPQYPSPLRHLYRSGSHPTLDMKHDRHSLCVPEIDCCSIAGFTCAFLHSETSRHDSSALRPLPPRDQSDEARSTRSARCTQGISGFKRLTDSTLSDQLLRQ